MRESEGVVVQLHDDGFGPESAVEPVVLDAQAPFVPRLDAPERLSEQAVVGENRVIGAVFGAGESRVRAAFRGGTANATNTLQSGRSPSIIEQLSVIYAQLS